MTGHDYLLKWLKETYPLMDSADYSELNYYDMQKFAVWIVNLFAIPPVIKSVCEFGLNPDNCIRKADTCFKCLPIK